MNPFDLLDFGTPGPIVVPSPRRFPQYSVSRDPLTGVTEVVTNESGGSQKATWTTWAPAAPPEKERKATLTAFEHPGRDEPTPEFQELVLEIRARNDPGPFLRPTGR